MISTQTPGTERDVYQALAPTGIHASSARTLCERARATGRYVHHTGTNAYAITWDAEAGYQVKRTSTDRDRSWTIVFRLPTANRFRRVGDWSGSWDQANELAGQVVAAHPELQVYYVPTLAAEKSGYAAGEDAGNVLTSTGRRVRIVDDANLADVLPARAMTEKRYLAAIARGDLDRGEAEEIAHANPELARALASLRAGDVVTAIVRAPSTDAAREIIAQVSERAVILALADLLFIEAEGHDLPWIRKAIVREARS